MSVQQNGSSQIIPLGGEMLTWSDLDPAPAAGPFGGPFAGPFAGPLAVPVLEPLLGPAARALVAGPHAPELLDRFADGFGSLDVIVRSWPDAHALSLRLNGKPVRIFCGAFEKFELDHGPYDVVLALDGIPRLFAADGDDLSWPDAVGRLRALARPGGHVVLGVDNAFGLDHLLDADTSVRPPADDQWPTSTTSITTAPPGLDTVRSVLAGHQLRIRDHYAVYPRSAMTSLMVHERALAGNEGDEVLSILASSAFANGLGDRPVLTDPRRMARELVRHGLGLRLAPGWLFITQAGADSPAADAAGDPAGAADNTAATVADGGARPEVLVTDNLDHPYWAVVLELARDTGGGWRRELVDLGRSVAPRAAGHLQRDPLRLVGPVPPGVLLEERFLTACRHDDLSDLRQLVRGYADWLRELAEHKPWQDPWTSVAGPAERLVVPAAAVFATFENVMLDGDRHHILDPSWDTTLQVPYEIALTRALRRFGHRLMAGGLRHPWPSGMSPNRLTVTLASMVGVAVTPHLLERSARLEVELAGQQRTNTEAGDQRLYFELQTMGEQPMGIEFGRPRGYREALATAGRLSGELSEAVSQIEWLDKTVQLREDELRRERKISADVKASTSFAIGRAITYPVRLVARLFRPILRTMNQRESSP